MFSSHNTFDFVSFSPKPLKYSARFRLITVDSSSLFSRGVTLLQNIQKTFQTISVGGWSAMRIRGGWSCCSAENSVFPL